MTDRRRSEALEPRMFDVDDERKGKAFEWLRDQAIVGGQHWRDAAIILEEWVHLKAAQSASAPIGEVVGHNALGNPVVRWLDGGLRPIGMKVYAAPLSEKQAGDATKVRKAEAAWLHKFINCTPFGEHAPQADIQRAHSIVALLAAAPSPDGN